MILSQKKFLQYVAWFLAGLLGAILFVMPATSQSDRFEPVQAFNTPEATWINPAFEEVAASHLEPNFY